MALEAPKFLGEATMNETKLYTDAMNDECVFAGRAGLCEYVCLGGMKIIRFTGALVIRDWEFMKDLFVFLKRLEGACVLDLSLLQEFDATLYTVIIWARVLSNATGVRFLIVANVSTETRLRAAGVQRWMPIVRDMQKVSKMLNRRPDMNAAA